jgi:hypothetical protein
VAVGVGLDDGKHRRAVSREPADDREVPDERLAIDLDPGRPSEGRKPCPSQTALDGVVRR